MRITLDQLRQAKACADQAALFESTFGQSAEVTLENCLRAAAVGLDLGWAADRLFSPAGRADYGAKRDAFDADYEAKRAAVFYEASKL